MFHTPAVSVFGAVAVSDVPAVGIVGGKAGGGTAATAASATASSGTHVSTHGSSALVTVPKTGIGASGI